LPKPVIDMKISNYTINHRVKKKIESKLFFKSKISSLAAVIVNKSEIPDKT